MGGGDGGVLERRDGAGLGLTLGGGAGRGTRCGGGVSFGLHRMHT